MIDVNQRDFFISVPEDMRFNAPTGFWEGVGATAAYNNMPLVESVQEQIRFGGVTNDRSFNPVDALPDEYLPYYDEFVRAKNKDHFDFIKQRVDNELRRKEQMAGASFGSQIVGSMFDPLFVTAFIPALNVVNMTGGILRTGYNFGKLGAAYGAASELRRAPFAQTDEQFESAMNVTTAAVFSGFFGSALKGATYTLPFFKSSANKIQAYRTGGDLPPLYDENGNIIQYRQGEKFDTRVFNPFGSKFQRMLDDKRIPEFVKELAVKMTYNSSVNLKGVADATMPHSVSQMAQTYEGSARGMVKSLEDLYSDQIRGHKQARFLGVSTDEMTFRTGEFNDWVEDTITRYIDLDNPNAKKARTALDGATPQQKDAFKKIETFFKQFDEDARSVGVLRDDARLRKDIEKITKRIDDASTKLAKLDADIAKAGGATAKQAKFRTSLNEQLESGRQKITDLEGVLDSPTRKSFRFAMYYNKLLLDGDEVAKKRFLDDVLIPHYTKEGLPNPEASAKKTLARIMEEDAEELEDMFSGLAGNSKHLRHRKTNLSEWQANDFLVKNTDVFFTYAQRMGRRIEFARSYDGEGIDEIVERVTKGLEEAKLPAKDIADIRAAFYGEYDRTMGSLVRSPDRWDNQLSKFSKNYAGYAFLHGAGLSAVTDAGTIVLAHGYRDVYRAAVAALTDRSTGKLLSDMQEGGGMLDMVRNFAQQKILGDTMKRIQPNRLEKAQEIGNRFMYTANGLGPITSIFKFLDGLIVGNKFYKMSQKIAQGKKLTKYDQEYLNRYGIDDELAKYIAEMPFEKADASNFWLANTDRWPVDTPKARQMKRRYQAAVTAHSDNSVVMGQSFDRPLIMDGVVYVRDNPAMAGMRKLYPNLFAIDKKVSYKGQKMVRIESGMMTLPFTFMNFVFGANNKILGAMLDPARQNRIQGATALIALSYMSFEIKSMLGMANWWDRESDSPDIIARVIDHSGLMGIYSDLGYMGLSMAGNLADNPEDFFIEPKFVSSDKDERFVDALVTPFGAPVDIGVGFYRAAKDFAEGNVSEGANELRRNAPFLGLPFIRDDVKELTNALASRY